MKQKTILFDLDGTLTDSGEGIIHCAQLTLAHYGLPVPDRQQLRVIVGPPLADSFLRFGIRPEDIDDAIQHYRVNYQDFGKFENFPYPGIAQLLQKLKAAGHRLYVATSKPETMSIEILEHFGLAQYFDIIAGAAADRRRDTKAKVISHLLSQIEVNGDILMVGDTVYDVIGAQQMGIAAIGVSWGYGIIADMEAEGAAAIAGNMDNLYQIIQNYP